jgi:hypothetical protein
MAPRLLISCQMKDNRLVEDGRPGGKNEKSTLKIRKDDKMKKTIMLMAVLGSFALALTAHANTLTLLNGSPQVTGGGPFTWNYTVQWANSTLQTGDFVMLTGGAGITGAAGPAGWTATFTATSATWTWNGSMGSPFPLGSGTGNIAGFSLTSTFSLHANGHYNSQDHVNSGAGAGTISTASGSVDVPSAPDSGTTVGLLGLALAGIEGVRRMIHARKA